MGTAQLYALTCPLITTSSGAKMGKTAQGGRLAQRRHAVALRVLAVLAQHRGRRCRALPRSCSPSLPLDEVARLAGARRRRDQRGQRRCWRRRRPPSSMAARLQQRPARRRGRRFEEGRQRRRRCRRSAVDGPLLAAGIPMIALFVQAGLVASNGEARRQVRGGGLRASTTGRCTDEQAIAHAGRPRSRARSSCRSGKKKHVLVRVA